MAITTWMPRSMAASAVRMPAAGERPASMSTSSLALSVRAAASVVTQVPPEARASASDRATALTGGHCASAKAVGPRSGSGSATAATWMPGEWRACARNMVASRPAPARPTRTGSRAVNRLVALMSSPLAFPLDVSREAYRHPAGMGSPPAPSGGLFRRFGRPTSTPAGDFNGRGAGDGMQIRTGVIRIFRSMTPATRAARMPVRAPPLPARAP
ncbi:hypothetical protein MTBUT4_150069 [Magnetospirillum sp. UT-4]|nr:hypothetical protein MTBUT4_150069 [Magnetospirillum sp. UT-4]